MNPITATATTAPLSGSPVETWAAPWQPWRAHLCSGLAIGLGLGVGARWFMRLISDDPEFTWSGTLAIVGIFTVFGIVQGIVAGVRARTIRHWITAPTRILGGLSYVVLGLGPGALLLPLLWCGALARWRHTWHRWIRFGLTAIAVANFVGIIVFVVDEDGFRPRSVLGFAVLGVSYVAATWAVGPTLRPRATSAS